MSTPVKTLLILNPNNGDFCHNLLVINDFFSSLFSLEHFPHNQNDAVNSNLLKSQLTIGENYPCAFITCEKVPVSIIIFYV
jgi:hypothetical protein